MSSIASAVTEACLKFSDSRSERRGSTIDVVRRSGRSEISLGGLLPRSVGHHEHICLAEQQAAAGSAIVPELARRDPSVDGANFDAAEQGDLAFREKLFVRSVTVPHGPSLPVRSLMSN